MIARAGSLHLGVGRIVRNETTGDAFRVVRKLGVGGFGAAYEVAQIAPKRPFPARLCLKIANEADCWHREAYFGQLLFSTTHAIRVMASFACVLRGKRKRPQYCLITELAVGGDLRQYLQAHPQPWSEAKARREIVGLLDVLCLLHDSAAVHRDVSPANVFVTGDRTLKLGDFGIAIHRRGTRKVEADMFNPSAAPKRIVARQGRGFWKPADDVYQVGQILAALLLGNADKKLGARGVKALGCSPSMKGVIQRCIGERWNRFADGPEMLRAVRGAKTPESAIRVKSLEGKTVVFTGRLGITRQEAAKHLRRAGGMHGARVSATTDVIVRGHSPQYIADDKGNKLLHVDREREHGHRIAVITEQQFFRLARIRGKT